jgi:hypothetical protein
MVDFGWIAMPCWERAPCICELHATTTEAYKSVAGTLADEKDFYDDGAWAWVREELLHGFQIIAGTCCYLFARIFCIMRAKKKRVLPIHPSPGELSQTGVVPQPADVGLTDPKTVHGAPALSVVSLNLGGRNLNPLEFVLDGDETKAGLMAKDVGSRAHNAVLDSECGPAAMLRKEGERVSAIFDSIYGSVQRDFIDGLMAATTWSVALEQVCRERPGLLNALNLATLQTGRPAPLEAPAECKGFRSTEDFLKAWAAWYSALDQAALPRADLEKSAEKKGVSVEDAFAGLFIFDLMGVATAQHVFPASPFSEMFEFAESLPFATYAGKHDAAVSYFTEQEAHIVFVQESRCFDKHPEVVRIFLPAFLGNDPFTAILVRKEMFADAENISNAVSVGLSAAMAKRFPDPPEKVAKAWATTIRRIAAVRLSYKGMTLCAASLHCSQSDGTADLLCVMKDVLKDLFGEVSVIVGIDSNVAGKNSGEFQSRLRGMGMDFGERLEAQQVTVAKTRTVFQTQIKKAGESDVSQKDFVLSWGGGHRHATAYSPDLCTQFGIDRHGKTVRLPTTSWPFDHAAVATKISLGEKSGQIICREMCAVCRRGYNSVCHVAFRCLHCLLVFWGLYYTFTTFRNGLPAPFGIPGMFVSAQLGVTVVLSVVRRPVSSTSSLTDFYFVASVAKNLVHTVFVGHNGEFQIFGIISLPLSVASIIILHIVVMKRLQAMAEGMACALLSLQRNLVYTLL